MKTLIAFLLVISTFALTPRCIRAQSDSLYKQRILDSLQQASIAYQKEMEIARKKAREEFLKKLESFPADSAFVLDISNMGFEEFPDISRFTNITAIQAMGNKLRNIKLSRRNLKQLESLDIRENNIKEPEIGHAPKLKSVYLGSNPIEKLPGSFAWDKNLQSIDFSKTNVRTLPWWMRYRKKPDELLINGGAFELSRKNVRRMRNLKTLQLAHLHTDSLPDYFTRLRKLERLTIAYCRLHQLPNNFDNLSHLHTLILYSDSFTEIPTVCYRLPELRHLDFYYNRIRSIPNGIDQLKKLEHLYLSFNQISILSPDIQNLHHLKTLHAHHNNMEVAPQWLARLDSLQILDLGYNDIEIIPDLSNLKMLKEVDFQDNRITKFPFQFLLMPEMRLIFLSYNPFEYDESDLKKLSKLSKEYAERGGRLILFTR